MSHYHQVDGAMDAATTEGDEMTQREMALVFYRNNLHSIGSKIESGRYQEALETLDEYIRDLVKARKDWDFANELRGYKTQIQAWKRQARRKAA